MVGKLSCSIVSVSMLKSHASAVFLYALLHLNTTGFRCAVYRYGRLVLCVVIGCLMVFTARYVGLGFLMLGRCSVIVFIVFCIIPIVFVSPFTFFSSLSLSLVLLYYWCGHLDPLMLVFFVGLTGVQIY